MMMMPPTARMAAAAATMLLLLLPAPTAAHVQVGDVDEYMAKRSQEAHLKNRGGPLDQLMSTATRYHENMQDRASARRANLDQGDHTTQKVTVPAGVDV
ncbi:hypothetical protein ACP4OV_001193 [Aristida adscensionis]